MPVAVAAALGQRRLVHGYVVELERLRGQDPVAAGPRHAIDRNTIDPLGRHVEHDRLETRAAQAVRDRPEIGVHDAATLWRLDNLRDVVAHDEEPAGRLSPQSLEALADESVPRRGAAGRGHACLGRSWVCATGAQPGREHAQDPAA